ncbi:MAG: hypothetical protein ACRD1T_06705 [Acidimicrobiia bacterium]
MLFQTVGAFGLQHFDSIPSAKNDDDPFFHYTDLAKRMLEVIPGERIACGNFVGVYSPAKK